MPWSPWSTGAKEKIPMTCPKGLKVMCWDPIMVKRSRGEFGPDWGNDRFKRNLPSNKMRSSKRWLRWDWKRSSGMPWNRLPYCSAKYQLSPNLTVKPLHVWSVFWLSSIIEQLLVFNDDSHPLQSIWTCLRYEKDVSSLSRCQTRSNGIYIELIVPLH